MKYLQNLLLFKIEFIIISCVLLLFSCSKEEFINNNQSFNKMNKYFIDAYTNDTLSIDEYFFDSNGNVKNHIYTDLEYPQANFSRTYQYNSSGNVIGFNGEVLVEWDGDIAKRYSEYGILMKTYEFEGEYVISINSNGSNSPTEYVYDMNNNLIAMNNAESLTGTITELLDYDTTKIHPNYYLRSILILEDIYISKNIYRAIKHHPFRVEEPGGTFINYPLIFINLIYDFNSEGRVISEKSDAGFYYSRFEYE